MSCFNLTRVKSILLGAAVGLTLISCGDADRRAESVSLNPENRMVEVAPAEALNLIHKANLKEIHFGELAKSKAQAQDVKQMAEQMVTDHQQADAKVMEAADGSGITLEEFDVAGDAETKEAFDRLNALEGEEFDKAFLELMVAEHQKLLTELEGASIGDERVSGVVAEILTTVKAHLDHSQSLLDARGTDTGDDKDKGQGQDQKQQRQGKPDQDKDQDQQQGKEDQELGRDQDQQQGKEDQELGKDQEQGKDQEKEEVGAKDEGQEQKPDEQKPDEQKPDQEQKEEIKQ